MQRRNRAGLVDERGREEQVAFLEGLIGEREEAVRGVELRLHVVRQTGVVDLSQSSATRAPSAGARRPLPRRRPDTQAWSPGVARRLGSRSGLGWRHPAAPCRAWPRAAGPGAAGAGAPGWAAASPRPASGASGCGGTTTLGGGCGTSSAAGGSARVCACVFWAQASPADASISTSGTDQRDRREDRISSVSCADFRRERKSVVHKDLPMVTQPCYPAWPRIDRACDRTGG